MRRSDAHSATSPHIEPVAVDLPITLGQFIKVAGLASTGGDAKMLVVGGNVRVNGQIETRRSHKLSPGDVVRVAGETARVVERGGDARGLPSQG